MLPQGTRSSPTVLLIVLVVASFIMMTFDIRSEGEGVAASLRTGAQSLAAPVQDASRSVVDPVVDFVDGLANLARLREENERLRTEIEQLRVGAAEAEQLRQDNELLRQFLNLAEREIPTVVAEVRGGTGPLDAGFVIDSGLDQGIVVGNPVVNQNDVLVGIVKEAFPNSATVVPVVGPTSGVEIITSAGELGILQGLGGADALELLLLDAESVIPAGEILRTSGGQRGVPAGLQVAEVLELIRPEGGLIRSTSVRPLADPAALQFVVVLQFSVDAGEEPPEEPADGTDGETDPEAPSEDDSEGGSG